MFDEVLTQCPKVLCSFGSSIDLWILILLTNPMLVDRFYFMLSPIEWNQKSFLCLKLICTHIEECIEKCFQICTKNSGDYGSEKSYYHLYRVVDKEETSTLNFHQLCRVIEETCRTINNHMIFSMVSAWISEHPLADALKYHCQTIKSIPWDTRTVFLLTYTLSEL